MTPYAKLPSSTHATKSKRKFCSRSVENSIGPWNGYSRARSSFNWHQHLSGSVEQGSANSFESSLKCVATLSLTKRGSYRSNFLAKRAHRSTARNRAKRRTRGTKGRLGSIRYGVASIR